MWFIGKHIERGGQLEAPPPATTMRETDFNTFYLQISSGSSFEGKVASWVSTDLFKFRLQLINKDSGFGENTGGSVNSVTMKSHG